MGFVDEVYRLYRDQMQGDEEDAVAIVLNILDDQSRENVEQLIQQMSDDEVVQMMGVYLVEMLKMKMVQDGKLPPSEPHPVPYRFH